MRLAVFAALSLAACVPSAITPAGHPPPPPRAVALPPGTPQAGSPAPGAASPAQPASFPRWEYYCFVPDSSGGVVGAVKGFEDAVNAAGRQGWELAIIEQSLVCMKRPLAAPGGP